MNLKKTRKKDLIKDAIDLYYNRHDFPRKIAEKLGKSQRTIYRWLQQEKKTYSSDRPKVKQVQIRKKHFDAAIFDRIVALKQELPNRTAVKVQQLLRKEFPDLQPSLSTIRKFLAEQGLAGKDPNARQGYIKFQRNQPNDLWQIDIAGVQTVEPIGKVYLFAVLDDCSRFIPAALYAPDEKGIHMLQLLREAFLQYGRPNQILADNGTQFKAILSELGTKYTRFLATLGVEPIFATPHHPQTKGKLERWFETVKQSFLTEIRFLFKQKPDATLTDLNKELGTWVHWYTHEKKHRSLPGSGLPSEIYQQTIPRVYRPMETDIDWDRWLAETSTRKVTKYNYIHFETATYTVPSGYVGLNVNLLRFDSHLDIYYHDRLLISHPLDPIIESIVKKKVTRTISAAGTIGYKGIHYSIDYKMRGSHVDVRESNDGQQVLIYFQDKLIKTLLIPPK